MQTTYSALTFGNMYLLVDSNSNDRCIVSYAVKRIVDEYD